MLASSGQSLAIIGRFLGHTQPQTTARYSHFYDDPLRVAAEQVGSHFGQADSDVAAVAPHPEE
jgi:hypothetical protein